MAFHGFQDAVYRQNVLFDQSRAVHLSGPLHQIVGFIYQKDHITLLVGREEPAQIHGRIKYIVVVADNSVCIQRYIQAELKRAYPVLLGISGQRLTPKWLAAGKKVVYRFVDPVIMAFGVRAVFR